jgi:hypothetical protein
MTEAEWLVCIDPGPMFAFLQGKMSDRQLRLLMVTCCSRVLERMPDDRCRVGVEVAGRFADGTVTDAELKTAILGTSAVWDATTVAIWDDRWHLHQLARLAHYTLVRRNDLLADFAHQTCVVIRDVLSTDHCGPTDVGVAPQVSGPVQFLRDIFGNPFRPATFDPAWRTSTAIAIAQQMYESRDFTAMPILADALQDAGCDNEDVLGHCRGPGPHVRGCWVVDLVLGKE